MLISKTRSIGGGRKPLQTRAEEDTRSRARNPDQRCGFPVSQLGDAAGGGGEGEEGAWGVCLGRAAADALCEVDDAHPHAVIADAMLHTQNAQKPHLHAWRRATRLGGRKAGARAAQHGAAGRSMAQQGAAWRSRGAHQSRCAGLAEHSSIQLFACKRPHCPARRTVRRRVLTFSSSNLFQLSLLAQIKC